jgi:hypothetical protein
MWPDVPLHLAAARLRPAPASADDDEDWDAVIARAKTQAATAKPPSLPPSLPREVPPEMQATPPPLAAPQAPALWMAKLKAARIAGPQDVGAKLDAVWGGLKKQLGVGPAFAAGRRLAIEDQVTPPPVAKADRRAEKRDGRVSSTRSALAGSRSAGRRSP